MVRAEFPSLRDYLAQTLNEKELAHVGLISFNQWSFALGAVIETALASIELGSDVTVALWADQTPMHDAGWTASRKIARLFLSHTRDQNAHRALRRAGLLSSQFAQPPLKRWKPIDDVSIPTNPTRAAIRELTYRNSEMGRSILQVHPDTNTPIRDDYVWPTAWVESAARSYAWAYDQSRELIEARGLTTVVVYNGRFMHDRAVAAAAASTGAKVLYYDTGGYETDFDLTEATTHDWSHLQGRMLKMYQTWGVDRDEIGRKWFLDRQTHADINNAIFVAEQESGYLEGVPEAEQLVVFFSSSGDEIAELDFDWATYFQSQENALSLLARECSKRPNTRLVVRTHPHMRLKPTDDLERWMKAVNDVAPDAHFDPYSRIDSYALMRKADIVFTYGSTSGVEAGFIGRPTVVMGPSAYDELGCVARITKEEEIALMLDNPPLPNSKAAVPFGLLMQRRGFNFSHIKRNQENIASLHEVELAEANELTRKLSEAVKQRQIQLLTQST